MSELSVAAATAANTSSINVLPSRFQRIGRSLEMWVPAAVLLVIAFGCFVWPLLYQVPNPVEGDLAEASIPPFSPNHLLGTDPLGNDIVSRLLHGGRVSLEVGLGSAFLGLVIGGALGIVSAYEGGLVDTVVTRILDMFLAFPSLVLALAIATYLGPSEMNVIWAITFFSVPAFARLARSSTQRLRERNFVVASRLLGTPDFRIMVRHVVPNVVPELLTFSLLSVSTAIIVEASLSFLGLGVPPPGPSWGNMIQVGQQNIYTAPELLLIPSAALLVTVLALNLLGDAIRVRLAAR